MNDRKGRWAYGLALAAALGSATAVPVRADEAAKEAAKEAVTEAAKADDEGGKITYSGFLDWYYQYSFNHPPLGTNLGGRAFDVKNDQFSLGVVQVNVVRSPSKELPIGITLTGTVGKNADIIHFTEPGTKTVRFLQQAFGSYTTTGGTPVTIDVGKFVTWLGYEVIESHANDNYSRGLLFTYAIPLYHMGVRATVPLSDKLTAGLYLVNGWNAVEDDNGGKSYGASLNFKPSGTVNVILNYIGGDEGGASSPIAGIFGGIGFPTAAVLNTHVLDLIATWNVTPKLKLALNADYATASKPGAAGGNWNGQAVYARYQFSPTIAGALRLEHFEDTAGLRTGFAQNINGITATLEHVWRGNLVSRLELRHDHAGTAGFFPSGSGGSRDQDSLTFSQVVKF